MATYVKYMKEKELIQMFKDMHRFEMTTEDGRHLIVDEKTDMFKTKYEKFCGDILAWRAPMFKLKAFEYADVLILGEGYVRYHMDNYNVDRHGKILEKVYGFERED